ncbi:ThuA domain-containing protein [Microbacterium sp. ZW T5_45]|uniref:ThuA domain-containing protein n=1 Tax=Microbacterium sp. ZW T5_45 TaxID=3378080 RepID=UPI003851BA16
MRAVIASGTGRYADPWHPFTKTSPLLAAVLEDAGFSVRVDEDVDHAIPNLRGVDLLVVNAGDPWREAGEGDVAPKVTGDPAAFGAVLTQGLGLLAMHCAVSSLRDYPDWFPAIGGMWVPGLSWHPPASMTNVKVNGFPDEEGGAGFDDFDVFDERYCRLQQLGSRDVVATHPGEQGPEPSAWVRRYGRSRIAVDVLGHDEKSYESEGHRQLITRLAVWAAHRDESPGV